MIKNVNRGQTLLVKGPARITILEGIIEVFGKIFVPKKNDTLIIPSANAYPLYAANKSKLEVYTNIEITLF